MRVIRTLIIAAVATATVAVAGTPAPAVSADAVAVLTTGSLAGAPIAVGDVLTASVAAGTTADFLTSSGGTVGVRCSQSAFTSTVVANPVAPGVATESTTSQTFGSCTANILGVRRVNSVIVDNTPFSTTVDSSGVVTVSGSTAAPIQTTLNLSTILGTITVTCVYRSVGSSITGAVSNVDSSITFTNQQFAKFSGPGTCPGSGFFTARYAPVQDTSVAGSPSVFTNNPAPEIN